MLCCSSFGERSVVGSLRSFSAFVGELFLFKVKYRVIHFAYIIYSSSRDIYYKGYSLNPGSRLREHHLEGSRFTKNKGPWELVYVENFETKKEALIRERLLKKYSHLQILELLKSPKNILNKG
ncbi:GIY-YIG nuclease family protein [Paucihalobacter sp.]|uniref:GIY-YIG nuclease family protein n=1 Tax=Paucihalobacter sp. TaxID=2850405 RepID=UPI002FDF3B12